MSLAAQFTEYGTTEALDVVDVPPPVPGAGQVRLAVRAAGVNPADWKILGGMLKEQMPVEFPAGLGSDVAGVVDAVGPDVTAFATGDEVLGAPLTGAYAEYALADPATLVARPATVPWEVAGGLAMAGGTAWTALQRLGVGAGDTLLVLAATGGVGTFAVQLARARGARVIGTAGPESHDRLRSLGGEPVTYGDGWERRVRELAPGGVDAVLDASGRGEIPGAIELAGGPGRVLSLVAFDAADTGIILHAGGGGDGTVPALNEILELIGKRRLDVPVSRVYPLREVREALEESRAGHVTGKITVVP
ncbi:NADP-dependent oxidoreductase [Streptomyces sp. NPDC048290]|uniref:NADP-dependent oxidoreductase n=1 Tax=Streptomyces sp. NPDC048290 TaxID=3155811 RepID=UPI0034369A25